MLDDDKKLRQKFYNKQVNARAERIKFTLTFDEFVELVRRAKLKSSDLGFSGRGYVLARYADKGGYTFTNCRFITQLENAREKRPLRKAAIRKAILRRAETRAKTKAFDPSRYSLKPQVKDKIRNSEWHQKRIKAGILRKSLQKLSAHPSFIGEKNSQFGSFWITNGNINKKWNPDKGKIPRGFRKGRIM